MIFIIEIKVFFSETTFAAKDLRMNHNICILESILIHLFILFIYAPGHIQVIIYSKRIIYRKKENSRKKKEMNIPNLRINSRENVIINL